MLRKLYVSYGVNDGRRFTMNFLCFVTNSTVAVTDTFSYTD